MLKKLFINARYFIAPLLILATLFGVLAGGPWVWTGVSLLILYTLNKLWVLDLMMKVIQMQIQH